MLGVECPHHGQRDEGMQYLGISRLPPAVLFLLWGAGVLCVLSFVFLSQARGSNAESHTGDAACRRESPPSPSPLMMLPLNRDM
jgi:hypothetical protein